MKLKKYVTDYLNNTISIIYLENLLIDYTKHLKGVYDIDLPKDHTQLIKSYIKSNLKKEVV